MIRKFSVTNTHSQSAESASASITPTGSGIASPTSQLESHAGEDGKKLYAQSLESTDNSVSNGQIEPLQSTLNPLLYPICSEHDVSTDGMCCHFLCSFIAWMQILCKLPTHIWVWVWTLGFHLTTYSLSQQFALCELLIIMTFKFRLTLLVAF